MIYSPQEDSFLLEREVKRFSGGKKVLDIGTGSGIQALRALKSGAREVLAVDINKEAVESCKKAGVNAVVSDLFSSIDEGKKFDLIIFNPPYLPFDEREDTESSLATTGGKKGNEVIIRFLEDAGNYLSREGRILLVVSSATPKSRIMQTLKKKKLKKKTIASKKVFMEKLEVWEIRKEV